LMNTHWLTLPKKRRIEILNQATAVTGLPASAIEKDWWVTLCLNAAFSLQYSANNVFKGGTSLSKSWSLIDRFSEDIDLAIDRTFFGFDEDISKSKSKSCENSHVRLFLHNFLTTLNKPSLTGEQRPNGRSSHSRRSIQIRIHKYWRCVTILYWIRRNTYPKEF
jgi:hypothetical protein